jgi:hypothetical protein
MKFIVPIFALFLISCSDKENAEWQFYSESIVQANGIIEEEIGDIFSKQEVAKKENPNLERKYLDRTYTLYLTSVALLDEVKMFLQTLAGNEKSGFDKDRLHSLLINYDSLVNVALKDTSIFHDYIKKCWKAPYSIEQYNTQVELDLLVNTVQLTNYWIAYEYYNRIRTLKLKFNRLKAAVIPVSKKLYQNETFTASLYLLAYDSSMNFQIEVDGKDLELHNGLAFYCDSTCENVGAFVKSGVAGIQEHSTEIIRQYPYSFNFRYKVVEK